MNILPRLENFLIGDRADQWLSESYWEENEALYFLDQTKVFRPWITPPFATKAAPHQKAYFVYRGPKGAESWAEVQIFGGRYKKLFIYTKGPPHQRPYSLLISGLILSFQIDLIEALSFHPIPSPTFGQKKTLIIPSKAFNCRGLELWTWSAKSFWQEEDPLRDYADLSYLRKRMNRSEPRQSRPQRPRPNPWWRTILPKL